MKKTHLAVTAIALLVLGAYAQRAAAATCTASISAFDFGSYDPLAQGPHDSSANLEITCSRDGTGTESAGYTVRLSPGGGTHTVRRLTNGPNVLFYNLYTTPRRQAGTIWGDGTGNTMVVQGTLGPLGALTPSLTAVHSVYGRIGARQSAPAGSYGDTIVVTVDY